MARVCDICGKRPSTGNNVSHSKRRTKRRWLPNLKSVRVQAGKGVKRIKACTSCISAGKVAKA